MNARERQAELRDAARQIIAMRDLVHRAEVHRSRGEEFEAQVAELRMDKRARLLPLGLRRSIALARYIGGPVANRTRREGIPAQAERLGIR